MACAVCFARGAGAAEDLFRYAYLVMVCAIFGGVVTRQVDLVYGCLTSVRGGVRRSMNEFYGLNDFRII